MCFRLWSSIATQPEISWPKVSGVASCRWVRPILTISLKATAFSLSVARSACSDGITFPQGNQRRDVHGGGKYII